jgi:hypothetical protein
VPVNRERRFFCTSAMGCAKELNLNFYFTLCRKFNLRRVTDLNMIGEIVKLLEEIKEWFQYLWLLTYW